MEKGKDNKMWHEYTAEELKRVTLKQIEERGLDDVLNELSAILAQWINFKNRAKDLMNEKECLGLDNAPRIP